MNVEWVTLWARSDSDTPETAVVKDLVYSPSGKILVQKEYTVDLTKYKRHRIRRPFAFSPILDKNGEPEIGNYYFIVKIQNEKGNYRTVSKTPLDFHTAQIDKV